MGREWLVGHPPGRCGEFGSHWWFGRFDLVSRFVLGPGRRCGPAGPRGRVDAKVLWSGLHSAGTLYRGPFSLRAAPASPMRIERRGEPDARLVPVPPACGRGRAGPRCCSSFVLIRPRRARPCPGALHRCCTRVSSRLTPVRPPVARAGGSPMLYENFESIRPLFARLWDGNGLSGTPRGDAASLGPMGCLGVSTECLGSFQALVAAVAPPDAVVGSTQKCFGPASIAL